MSRKSVIEQKNDEIFASPEINRVRRQALAVGDEAWIKALLHRGAFGTLATVAGDQPFLNTHTFVYDEANHCIYFHRDPVGRTSANLTHNSRVCYTVVEMGRMYSGPDAMDFGVEYCSVVIFGTARQVALEEAAYALRLLMEKYAPHLKFGVDYIAFKPECPMAAAVYRVDIERWSGKKKEVAPDHPGAYNFLDVRSIED